MHVYFTKICAPNGTATIIRINFRLRVHHGINIFCCQMHHITLTSMWVLDFIKCFAIVCAYKVMDNILINTVLLSFQWRRRGSRKPFTLRIFTCISIGHPCIRRTGNLKSSYGTCSILPASNGDHAQQGHYFLVWRPLNTRNDQTPCTTSKVVCMKPNRYYHSKCSITADTFKDVWAIFQHGASWCYSIMTVLEHRPYPGWNYSPKLEVIYIQCFFLETDCSIHPLFLTYLWIQFQNEKGNRK